VSSFKLANNVGFCFLNGPIFCISQFVGFEIEPSFLDDIF